MISLTNFYWLVTNLCLDYICINQRLVNILLVDHLQNIHKEFKNLLNTGLLSEIYKSELDNACFQHDMA